MTKASWYKFWKRSGPAGGLTEDYIWFDPDDEDGYCDDIKNVCEYWAENHGGGFNTHYSYGYKKINIPPFQWLKRELEWKMNEQKRLQRWVDKVSETLLRWDEKSEEDE